MNRKDMVLEAFALKEPDVVPSAIFGGDMWALHTTGASFESLIGCPKEMARIHIETSARTGSAIVYLGSGFKNYQAAALGGAIRFSGAGVPHLVEPLISEPLQVEELNVEDLGTDQAIQTIWEATSLVASRLGDEVVVAACAWGPFTLAAQIYGLENLMRAVVKRPREAKMLVEFATRVILRFYEPLLAKKVIALASIADMAASGDLVSRKHFAEFALPSLEKLIASIRSRGARTLLHVCGDTSDKLDLLVESGADCVSIDHKVDIAEAKRVFRGRTCLAGNVDPVHVLLEGTPSDVEEACWDCVEKAAPGGGFILMPGCDIPPAVPEENLRTFLRVREACVVPSVFVPRR
jgi:uroporphyrinogen decarboxylase